MSLLRNLTGGLQALFRKKQAEQEMDEELRGYLDAAVQDKMRAGMGPEEALRAARVEMGSVEAVKDEIRSAGWESGLEALWQDVRFAVRTLCKNLGFTAILVLVLGIGIGGTTAMFSLIDGVLLRPLPFRHPEQLVRIHDVSPSDIDDVVWFREADVFSDVATYRTGGVNVAAGGGAERLSAAVVSAGFFALLGAPPQLGRPFGVNEERTGKSQVAILSHRLWLRTFAGDRMVF
jgi:hypothetical protein